MNQTTRPRHLIRHLVFWTLIAFMFAGPMAVQVFGVRSNIFRKWVMFHSRGSSVHALELYEIKEGEKIPVDRFAEKGYSSWRVSPRAFRAIDSQRKADKMARKLCRPDRDLRMKLWAPRDSGWVEVRDGSKNLCLKK